MSGKETSDVIQTLHNIRRNPNDMKYYDTQNSPKDFTVYYNISYCWFPGCLILKIYMIISDILFIIFTIPIVIITSKLTCDTPCQSAATGWPCC